MMTDQRRKIHVFLGAPPAPALQTDWEAGLEAPAPRPHPHPPWSCTELRWQDGRLKSPPTGEGQSPQEDIGIPYLRGDEARSPTRQQSHDPGESRAAEPSQSLPPGQAAPPQSITDQQDAGVASLHHYLDGCFPAANSSAPSAMPRPSAMSLQTQYLSTWTLSQALVLRARIQSAASPVRTAPSPQQAGPCAAPQSSGTPPELFSPASSSTATPPSTPATPPQPGSMDLFSWWTEEGGVVLEVAPDGLLCSQEGEEPEPMGPDGDGPGPAPIGPCPGPCPGPAPIGPCPGPAPIGPSPGPAPIGPGSSSSPDPPCKRPRRMDPECTGAGTSAVPLPAEGGAAPTALLARCVGPAQSGQGRKWSVLVAAVHPCHLKEVTVRSGVRAGSSVPLATIVVTDQSGVEVKVALWRQAAFWALTVFPGDILLITGLEVNHDKWRGETLLRSSYSSKMLNLGPISTSPSPPATRCVSSEVLRALCVFVAERRPLLASVSRPLPPQTPDRLAYARLASLRTHTLVHALLRVTHAHTCTEWSEQAEGVSRRGGVRKAVLSVEQGGGQRGALVLWGAALTWLPRITRNTDALWDFRVLLVRDSVTSDLPELHSTPWGSVQPVFPQDRRAKDFWGLPGPPGPPELDLRTLLSQKYSGDVDLRVNIISFQFQASTSQNAPAAPLDSGASLEHIMETLGGDVTYAGCGRCAFELGTDANSIYLPCYPCLPHTGVRRYYRPVVLMVKEASSTVCVQVPPILLEKTLLNTPADRLNKTINPGSEVRHLQLVAERIHSLVSLPLKSFLLTVRSHFSCDENSVPLVQDFLLLDFQFLGE